MSAPEDILSIFNETNEVNSFFWDSYDKLWNSYGGINLSSAIILMDYHPWIMSVVGSVLVGLSGILPLLIIPLDETATLKTGSK